MSTTTPSASKTFCRHPDPTKEGVNIDSRKYAAMRKALLAHIPRRQSGVPYGGMKQALRDDLEREVFAGASVDWYLVTVKLDLEARGLIERVPGVKPQFMRRVSRGKR